MLLSIFLTKMKPTLPFIVFESTRKCNLDCKYCYNIWKRPNHIDYTENSKRKAKDTLKYLYKQVNIDNIAFSGGEPFLCDNFLELPLYSRLKGSDTFIITNGTIAKKEDFAYLKKIGITVFQIPFLSHNYEIHNKLTNNKTSHQNVITTIKNLMELKVTVIAVIVLTKINLPQFEETLIELLKLGVKNIMLNRYNIVGNGLNFENEILPELDELQKAYFIANKVAENNDISISSNVCTPFCILNPKNYLNIQFASCSNNPFEKPITLDKDGNIRLCNHSPVIIGNIYEENIFNLLTSYHDKLNNNFIPNKCINCIEFTECKGGCIGSTLQMNSDLKYDIIIEKYNIA